MDNVFDQQVGFNNVTSANPHTHLCNIIGFRTCENLMENGIPGLEGAVMVNRPPDSNQPANPVPEPGAALLFGVGLVVSAMWSRKNSL